MTRGDKHPFLDQVWDGYRYVTRAEYDAALEHSQQLKEGK